jgi:hypothetical protein
MNFKTFCDLYEQGACVRAVNDPDTYWQGKHFHVGCDVEPVGVSLKDIYEYIVDKCYELDLTEVTLSEIQEFINDV